LPKAGSSDFRESDRKEITRPVIDCSQTPRGKAELPYQHKPPHDIYPRIMLPQAEQP